MSSLKLKTKVGTIVSGIGLFVVAVLLMMCITKIDPGYNGVVYSWDGGVQQSTLDQGIHLIPPWKNIVAYPISSEVVYYNDKDQITVSTKDGKTVACDATYAFHVQVDKLPDVFTRFRGQKIEAIEAGFMRNEMYKAINECTSNYNLLELIGDKRTEINNRILTDFRNALEQEGIVIETFNLSNVKPDEQTQAIIQKVIESQNELERSKIEKERAQIEAEKLTVEAEGKAKAQLIAAEATAKSNQLLQQSLTELIIKKQALEKWDGKLSIISGSNQNIVDIKSLLEK